MIDRTLRVPCRRCGHSFEVRIEQGPGVYRVVAGSCSCGATRFDVSWSVKAALQSEPDGGLTTPTKET